MKRKSAMLLALLLVTVFIIGCSANTKVNDSTSTGANTKFDEVRKYADPITQSILEGLNEKDYEKFSKDFAVIMKESLDSKAFDILTKDFDKRIGAFQSLSFSNVEKQEQYTIVVYTANYSNEPNGVVVRTVFEHKDGINLVSGLYFDSPNLRTK